MFNKRLGEHDIMDDSSSDMRYHAHDELPECARKNKTVNIPVHSSEIYGYFDQEDCDVILNDDDVMDGRVSPHWGIDVYHPKRASKINPEIFNVSRIRLRRGLCSLSLLY